MDLLLLLTVSLEPGCNPIKAMDTTPEPLVTAVRLKCSFA
jgi:hypothetical protein